MARDLPQEFQGLLQARAYPHAVEGIRVITTHISWVLLTGEFAYKIKRPVCFPFVDLRSRERRRFLCHEELRLNRRFAPELYSEVCPITCIDGEARIGGDGPVVEHAVKMRQFPDSQRLDRLLEHGSIEPAETRAFGEELARIHDGLPRASATQEWGQPAGVGALMIENFEECCRAAHAAWSTDADAQPLRSPLLARVESSAADMSRRYREGRVRECHGDLHASNLVRIERGLVAFDCLEFDPTLRWIDVADEVAFLAADLAAAHADPHAHAFLGGYLDQSGDFDACRVLDLYRAHRSLVRAKVLALTSPAGGSSDAAQRLLHRRQYLSHLSAARAALEAKRPQLILMAGISGSGKTWLAERIAPPLKAVHIRSDIERKRLAGIGARDRSHSGLGGGIYDSSMNRAVYERLVDCARAVLEGGCTAILDATFQRRSDRERFTSLADELADRLRAPARLVLCHASQGTLERRIAERSRRDTDPSEAGLSVMRAQRAGFEPIDAAERLSVIDASTEAAGLVERVLLELKRSP